MKRRAMWVLVTSLLCAADAMAGIIGQWDFNGDADDWFGPNNGTLVNGASGTTDRFSNTNGAIALNASNQQYINIANGGGLHGLPEGSISLFAR